MLKSGEWTLRSRRVVTPEGTRAADVVIRNETIVELRPFDGPEAEGVILDVGDLVVLPGLVALHRDEPGPGSASGSSSGDPRWSSPGTRNCLAGGVTTLIHLPPRRGFDPAEPSSRRMVEAEGRIGVDCGLVVALGSGNADRIASWVEAGYLGVEAILEDRPDPAGWRSTEADLRVAMPILADLGRPLLVDSAGIAGNPAPEHGSDPFGTSLPDAEFAAIRLLIRLCRETRCRVHLIHPSASEALPMIAEARAEGQPLTVSTCPAHLGLESVEVGVGAPGSSPDHARSGRVVQGRLWDGLETGLIDAVDADLARSRTGAAAGQVEAARLAPRRTLPAVWAEARGRGFHLDDLGRWLASRPAGVMGLGSRKGSIAPGFDADFVVFDPDPPALDDPGPLGPARGPLRSTGRVEATILRGLLLYQSGQFFEHPRGALVLRLEETQPIPGTDA